MSDTSNTVEIGSVVQSLGTDNGTSPSQTNTNTNLTSVNLLSDFRKILSLFDRENQIYKAQISILKDTINTIKTNDDTVFNDITRELNELKLTLNNISGQIDSKSIDNSANTDCISSTTSASRQLNDYLCQICLDAPRDCLLEPCMHFCICVSCVTRLSDNKCPVCRRHIDFYQNG